MSPTGQAADERLKAFRAHVSSDCFFDTEAALLLIQFAGHKAWIEAFRDEEVFQLPHILQLQLCHQIRVLEPLYGASRLVHCP